ncbi:hypothetical protein BABINDRAFT_41676 [Babjeviella inositovora NRRL Y-12698]|uniref:Dienelactone hydrolase domain-containing protein n=1 Tax=Babjeviella inositovora NRRL Y-12698 TaxID=984486 RepID=A0A1E3QI80_9ASCO|nr:uncharacterized protein BABINDRAFT_41676 [Babjeviella inositovora NRRL Y-12698]ODQ77405.1 hypothetical protein BABINDRAFT_41676 [Babjeviella inositovora NRRL Y-12698]
MASNPPGACCLKTTFHEGAPVGKHSELFGLNTYITGENKGKFLIILTDIYGNTYNNVLLVADQLAANGYQVLIPDILDGDDAISDHPDGMNYLMPWLRVHEKTAPPIIAKFLESFKAEYKPSFVGGIGYCFGAKYVVQQLGANGVFDAAAIAHPSFVSIEEVKAITKPLLISAAETDNIFPEELRRQTEDTLKEMGATYQISLFSGVEHGFAVRGDLKKPAGKYALEKTLLDQSVWFNAFSTKAEAANL